MNIIFRVDASFQIGSGHVMRCLTLADELIRQGNNILFISRKVNGNLFDLIIEKGYELYPLESPPERNRDTLYHSDWLEVSWETDAAQTIQVIKRLQIEVDWLVVDHYAIDAKWENMIRKYVKQILVIDDLADRFHDCDVLLDQNYYLNMESRYKGLLPSNTMKLLGPEFSLIRDEFVSERKCLEQKLNEKRRDILVFFGGSDPTNETLKIIHLLKELNIGSIKIHVVVGKNNKQKDKIKAFCESTSNLIFHYQINFMAKLMKECSFAICAGGSFTWERYCVGLPAILIAVAYNQIDICRASEYMEIDCFLGEANHYSDNDFYNFLEKIFKKENLYVKKKKAMKIVDGFGKNRVIQLLK